jgi:shikimate dehydrogenase
MPPFAIDAKTRLVTLLGHPISHSLSPIIHNAAFRAQGVNMVYLCLSVPPEGVVETLAGLRAARFVGSNVTIPHKQRVLEAVDDVTDRARAVGAVNTIVCRQADDGKTPALLGDNTDVAGFLAPLAGDLGRLEGMPALVFGAGGAARAVIYALLRDTGVSRVWIVARDPAKAERLAVEFATYDRRGALTVLPPAEASAAVRESQLLVNTTPLGMQPDTGSSPWEVGEDFHAGQRVYDLVYNPRETRFLREASARGAKTLGGLPMLIEQAAASYIQWTGLDMPREAVREALAGVVPHLA